MSEIDALVGIYGAVDKAVQGSPKLRADVSRLLPLYADPGLQWYDDFEAWLKETRAEPVSGPLFPELEEALSKLAEIAPKGRLRARRLFALTVATQGFPEMQDPSSELGGLAVGALRVEGLAGGEEAAARSLLELLTTIALPDVHASPQQLKTWWSQVIHVAGSDGLLQVTSDLKQRPCSGQLVSVPGITAPVAALRTEFETDEIDFEQAKNFINPANWAKCMPSFWCAMDPLAVAPRIPGGSVFREVVSSDECALGDAAAFWAETELEFEFGSLSEAVFTNYRLSKGRPLAGDRILLDEGSLVVAKVGPGERPLLITTTKRIQFSHAFSSEALAIIACALGYADVVGELLNCAASGPKEVVPFPKVAPLGSTPEGLATALSDCVEECAAATGIWRNRVARRPYTAGDLVLDMTNSWAWALRKGAAVVELGASAAQTGTSTGAGAGGAASNPAAWISAANESGLLFAQALNALASASGLGGDENIVTSQPFQGPPGATLTLDGPLVEGAGLDSLPESVLSIVPVPGGSKGEFELTANATGHRGATYVGTVRASADAALAAGSTKVIVWITVP